ncbi:MAG: hypothetical protein ACXWC4_20520 [Telluria sp.]
MKAIRTLLPIAIATLLTACGGSNVTSDAPEQTVQTAALMEHVDVTGPATPPSANDPQPDCAAEGCSAVRVIDENLEVAHLAAVRRAQQQEGTAPGA